MSGALGLGVLLIGAALLVYGFGTRDIAGLRPDEFALLAGFSGIVLVMTSWIVNAFRRGWTDGIWTLVVWSLVSAGLVGVYIRRGDVVVAFDRLIGEVSQGRAVVTDGGEVVVARRANGSFTIAGRVNEHDARFIFDTGASTVVLTAESAAETGVPTGTLSYSVPVATANGRTLAAPVVLESVTIGSITERRIQALVAKPGVLHENLLGMTFLERLGSYEVRGNRLILRPQAAARP